MGSAGTICEGGIVRSWSGEVSNELLLLFPLELHPKTTMGGVLGSSELRLLACSPLWDFSPNPNFFPALSAFRDLDRGLPILGSSPDPGRS